jgi:hypothetical protein
VLNEHSEWVTITHPFHPLHGQQFAILKERMVGAIPTLVLRGSSQGTFAVPCEWTNRSTSLDRPTVLEATKLLQLTELVSDLRKKKFGKRS